MDKHKALARLQHYCAKAERSRFDVRQKLIQWLITPAHFNEIIEALEDENFLNEQRFARAYTNDKFRFEKWGKGKIRMGLKQKNVDPLLITDALNTINNTDYRQMALDLLAKKEAEINKEKYNTYEQKQKKAAYLIQKGYEPNLIWELLGSNWDD